MKRPLLRAALYCVAVVLTMASCEKPEQSLGLDLQPENDLFTVGGLDTFSIQAYTVPEDSIRTDQVNPALFGAYIDPIFGFAKASHVTQVQLSTAAPNLLRGTNVEDAIIDSMILVLGYMDPITQNVARSYYGRLGEQFIQVYEVGEDLGLDQVYYQKSQVRILEGDLVKSRFNSFIPRPRDSVVVAGTKRAPQLRIPLKEDLARRFLEADDAEGLDINEFLELFKGIQITVDESKFDPNRAGIIYFDTFTRTSFMAMHYRILVEPDSMVYDTLAYIFPIASNTAKFGQFEQDHTLGRPSLVDQVENLNRTQGQQDLYIQAMGGTKIMVEFPHLENLRDSADLAINSAVLTIPIRTLDVSIFEPPTRLFLFGTTSQGNSFLLPDQIDGTLGGFFDPASQSYIFNISRYVQQVLLGSLENNPLEVVTIGAASSANRVVINGPEFPSRNERMKLNIIFTKF